MVDSMDHYEGHSTPLTVNDHVMLDDVHTGLPGEHTYLEALEFWKKNSGITEYMQGKSAEPVAFHVLDLGDCWVPKEFADTVKAEMPKQYGKVQYVDVPDMYKNMFKTDNKWFADPIIP